MKKIILKSLLFSSFLVVLFYAKPIYLLLNDRYKSVVAGKEIYFSIFKSKQKKKAKKIILGDSVAYQLFPNTSNNDTINSLACNQAISLAGQYILLNNYINAGNKLDTVYLIFNPFSFKNNLDQKYTYHYFLKPFFIAEYKPLFTELVFNQVNKIPYSFICREPYILTSNWAPNFITLDKNKFTMLSQISLEYLQKIKQLSIKNNFQLIILPVPISLRYKAIIKNINMNEIINNNLASEFKNFFSQIIYLEDTLFEDGTHLKQPLFYTNYFKNNFVK